ncbi:hypothetical protein Cgig2_011512 [Carnegiea gigantea]|uniref:Uncharacterized protein n=1 Tax=Carnegiea gigantea TaxID=171969 RepID=A0A9Q1GZS3_9CARY|nr:hypothetical protein Cgig2_011512 [Carnegiea gigantea]
MALCRKGGKENSQELKRLVVLVGQRRIFSHFCDLCIELVDKSTGKNGGTVSQRIRQKDIVSEFQKKTNLAWSREQLKGKYDGFKSFNIENNDTSILGLGVSAWQELWYDDSPISTPPPVSQGVEEAKICALLHFDPMHLVLIFACELVQDPQKRMILFGLPNDDSRGQWLTYLYEKYGKK